MYAVLTVFAAVITTYVLLVKRDVGMPTVSNYLLLSLNDQLRCRAMGH